MASLPNTLTDRFGRTVDYVRLSVTDRCDLRCTYCMAERMQFLPKRELLTIEELATVARAFIARGVRKIRITGGEPLVRKGMPELFDQLGQHLGAGLDDLELLVVELDDPAALEADHVVVVIAIVELEDRMTTLEIVPRNEAGSLELRQHAVDRREADFLARIQQVLVNILSARVPVAGIFENLEDLQAWQRDLEAGLA